MSDWRQSGMRPFLDRRRECRYCPTSSGVKKIRDTISRVKQHFQEIWAGRKKNQ